ncbi:DEAD/DEAH box helicase [Bacillus litorisediminis]|uniref:DEAD/DEAH box helicase n=1 Tax=Bacillus litorisediminis TaxID=2922713 RepID=UPI001FABEBAB|nr:DEAD/DEAH box helicase [Bacillus litorisediminis]
MVRLKSIKIHAVLTDDFTIRLGATNEEHKWLPLHDWKHLFFQWHQESFYGTLYVKEMQGFLELTPWQVTDVFANEPFNSYVDWDWDETSDLLISVSRVIYESIVQKRVIPSFQPNFPWKIPAMVWDEFSDDFWESPLPEEIFPNAKIGDWVQTWFQQVMESYISQPHVDNEWTTKWKELKESTYWSQEELAAYFTEEKWRQWTSENRSSLPFHLGLRLEEPETNDDPWTLTPFLQSVVNHEEVYSWNEVFTWPSGWLEYEETVNEEVASWKSLIPFMEVNRPFQTALNDEQAWAFLTHYSEKLVLLGINIWLPSWWRNMKEAKLKLQANVKETAASSRPSMLGMDQLLDFQWKLSLNGEELSEEEFRSLVEQNRHFLRWRGDWVKLDPAFMKQIQEMMKHADKHGLKLRDLLEQKLSKMNGSNLNMDEEESDDDPYDFIQIKMNRQLRDMLYTLTNQTHLPLQKVPDTLQGELRPYQIEGFSWLYFLRGFGFGGCLADDMGLGKTIQFITYLLKCKEEENDTVPALIIAPTSVIGNWEKELAQFAPSLKVYIHYGQKRLKGDAFKEEANHADVVLTTYGLSHIDEEELASIEWSAIGLDEAQNIKNAGTKQSRSIRKLKGKHHIALTGTPIENRLSELWSIFDFLNHGYLGSLHSFQHRYIIPIERDDDKEQLHKLQALIRPFLLRRTKTDEKIALNLPDKLEQKQYCTLTPEQAALYEEQVQQTFAKIQRLTGLERRGLVLQMLGKLKQLCDHPSLFLKEEQPAEIISRSMKMKKVIQLLDDILYQNENALIFTQYIGMGQLLQQVMKKRYRMDIPFLNGSVPKQQRDRWIEQFQNNEFPIFILSLKAGGTGLNLTAANHVIHYDRWWNPAVENQATDRAYRIGQKKFVHVHKLLTSGTLEEKIDALLEQKNMLNEAILTQGDQWLTEYTDDQLLELVSLG